MTFRLIGSNDKFGGRYERVYDGDDGIKIYKNTNQTGSFLVNQVMSVSTFDEGLRTLSSQDFIPTNLAVVLEGGNLSLSKDKGLEGEVQFLEYSNNRIKYAIRANQATYLATSESFYPGWKAYIDGVETDIYKTNGIFRGVYIPNPGEHLIEFRYVPKSFYLGLLISGSFAVVLIGLVVAERIYMRRVR